ncbi:MAG: GNAT family N-acetyltransferase [Bacillaceae bacterium]|nr:GNAT family N-acetyltransferase [Bacillaceae bacterium]
MYKTRWASMNELPMLADYWYSMACEMGEIDGVPEPDSHRVEQVKNMFVKEMESGKLLFRVAVDSNDQIVACAGGLLRTEYAYPLAEEQSLFGWVISVYTLKEHRKKGLAHQLVDEVCMWLRDQGAKRARLWASSAGRKVYENLGFQTMIDMSKPLS